jgi:predicted transcriptional regulator
MVRRRLPSGELERQVLDILWATGVPMSPGEVHEAMSGERDLAYTTVMTTLSRLCDKGELVRSKRGRAFAYEPVMGREERVAHRMQSVLETATDQSSALSAFAAALPPEQQEALREALAEPHRRP